MNRIVKAVLLAAKELVIAILIVAAALGVMSVLGMFADCQIDIWCEP